MAETTLETQRRLSLRLLRDSLAILGWRYGLFVLAVIGFGLLMLLPPQLFRFFTESAQSLSSLNAQEFLAQLAIFGSFVAIALLISSAGSAFLHEWLRLRVESNLRRRVLRRVHEVPLSLLDGAQRGDWIARVTTDLDQTELFFTDEIPGQIRQAAILVGAGILFFYYSGSLALLPLATAILLAVINLRIQRKLSPLLAELRQLHGGVFQLLIESLEGIRTIRSHGVEPYAERRFDHKLNEITTKSMKVVRYLGALLGGTELAGHLMITACLTAVAWGMSRGQLTLHEVLIYPFFIGLFYSAAQTLASSAYQWNRYFVEGGRLGEVLYDVTPLPAVLHFSTRDYFVASTRTLEVHDLEIGHEGAVAGPIQFQIDQGEILAVVGRSGSGKSTFLEVLAGLRPALRGKASLRDGDGRTLWRSDDKRAPSLPIGPCALVEQHPYIFEGTLRENLTFGNSDRRSDAVLWEAVESVGLVPFARGRGRGGLEYQLKDRGGNLSEGERYRIALCRALLLKRPFLLLDEPFAALDQEAIEIVIIALEAQKEKCGVVIVSHHLPDALNIDGLLNFEGLRLRAPAADSRESATEAETEIFVDKMNKDVGLIAPFSGH